MKIKNIVESRDGLIAFKKIAKFIKIQSGIDFNRILKDKIDPILESYEVKRLEILSPFPVEENQYVGLTEEAKNKLNDLLEEDVDLEQFINLDSVQAEGLTADQISKIECLILIKSQQ